MNSPSNIEFERIWILLKRKWLTSFLIVLAGCTCGLFAGITQEKVYRSEGSILIKRKANSSSLTGVGEDINEKEPLYKDSIPLETEAAVISSSPVLELAIKAGNLQNDSPNTEPITPETILKKLEVEQIESSDLLRVSFTDKEPKQAARVVEAILSAYLQNNIQTNQNDTVSARQFIEKQIPQAEANLRNAELAIEHFKSRNKFLDSQQSQQAILNSITLVKEQITQAELDALKSQNEANSLLQQIGITSEEALSSTKLSQSQGVQEVLRELQDTQSKIAISKNSLNNSHPIMIDLLERERSLKQVLRQRTQLSVRGQRSQQGANLIQAGELQQNTTAKVVDLKAKYLSASNQVTKLKQILKSYEQQAQSLPKLQRRLDELNRRRETAQLTYSSLIKKQEELRVAENQSSVNARIISPAVIPTKADNPSLSFYLLIGGFLGGVLSLANLLLAEARDKSLKSLDEVQQLFNYRLLSVIPFEGSVKRPLDHMSTSKQLVDGLKVSAKVNQALMCLDTNFMSISSEFNCHVIGVTSTVAGEGKSTLVAFLAKRLAQRGQKTLIIDADFSNAVQHELWDLSNGHGLWNYLQIEHINSEIECRSVEPNLHLLTAGSPSAGSEIPIETFYLGMFSRLEHLVNILRETYDYLIIDCPDLTSNASISSLAKAVDAFLFTVRPEAIDAESALLAKNQLNHTQSRVLGMVVNSKLAGQQTFNQIRQGRDLSQDLAFESQLKQLLSGQQAVDLDQDIQDGYSLADADLHTSGELASTSQSHINQQLSLQKLEFWIDEQEQALVSKISEISHLQDKLYSATYSKEKEALASKISQEKENLKFLKDSLEGQRQQIRARLELLRDI